MNRLEAKALVSLGLDNWRGVAQRQEGLTVCSGHWRSAYLQMRLSPGRFVAGGTPISTGVRDQATRRCHRWATGLSLAAAIFCALPWSAILAAELLRDEALILQLLQHGELDLNPPVARELPAKESQLRIRRVGLSGEGHSIRAAFRDKTRRVPASRDFGMRYRDAWYHEVAAYVVARELGLNIIPPTVMRPLHIATTGLRESQRARPGALQLWVENTVVEYDLKKGDVTYPGDPVLKNQQMSEILAFDCIIGNLDRHAGNILIDLNPRYPDSGSRTPPLLGKLWAIDHSKAFHRDTRIDRAGCRLERLDSRPVSLTFMQGLRAWRRDSVTTALREARLTDRQLRSLHLDVLGERLGKLLKHLEELQAASGLKEDAFFSDGVWHRVR